MTDRKNLKVDPETYERLREVKGDYETWDGCLNRLADAADTPPDKECNQ